MRLHCNGHINEIADRDKMVFCKIRLPGLQGHKGDNLQLFFAETVQVLGEINIIIIDR